MHTKKLKNILFIIRLAIFGLLLLVNKAVIGQKLQPIPPISTFSLPSIKPRLPILLSVIADSIKRDSINLAMNEDLKSEVQYSARDSSITDVDGKVLHLYGDAKVVYGSITLKADYIRLNWAANEVFAKGTLDTAKRKVVGKPIFQEGTEKYDSDEIRYNFKSKKAIIKQIITQQGEGNVRGSTVKKDEEDNLYIGGQPGAIYTTCNMPEPHFHIAARKIKLVKDKQVISGPFNLVLAGIPTPIGLPFGFFPIPKKKDIGTSGVIMPQYGEEPNGRGYYLRGGGYYFALSDKVNLTLTTQIYTKGSWGVGALVPYSVKYRYSGNLMVNYNYNKTGDEVEARNKPRPDLSFMWSHSPVARGKSSFSASVNIGSNSYNQNNATDVQRYTQNTASSSIQYSKQFGQFARMGSSIRVNQRFPLDRNAKDSLGRPKDPGNTEVGWDLNFGINQISPFALKGGTGRWYESFRLGMDFNGGVTFNNTNKPYISTDGLGFAVQLADGISGPKPITGQSQNFRIDFNELGKFFSTGQARGQYSIPISLPNIKLGYINITPGVSLTGEMFTKHYEYDYANPIGQSITTAPKVLVREVQQTSFVNQVSFNAGINTRVYGTFKIHGRRLEAIRHTLIPSMGFSYVPDQSNLYQLAKVGITKEGKDDIRYLNKYRTIGGPQGGIGKSSASMSWSLANLLEAKIRPKTDSTGKEFEKKTLLNSFNFNGSYDFTRDSLKSSDITLSAASQLTKNISFNFNSTFDPYAYQVDEAFGTVGRKIDRWSFTAGQGFAKLSNVNFGFNARFAPKAAEKPKQSKEGNEQQLKQINKNPEMYVDFNIPWTINLMANFGYTRQGLSNGQTTATMQVNGDFSLTPKWKFVYTTGFDFINLGPSITNLQITRDLHCWEMSFNWTPFAATGSLRASNYSFDLRVKSALLRDLKLSRRRSFYDRGGY